MTYYKTFVFNGTKEIPVLKPRKSLVGTIQQAMIKLNQPFRVKEIKVFYNNGKRIETVR